MSASRRDADSVRPVGCRPAQILIRSGPSMGHFWGGEVLLVAAFLLWGTAMVLPTKAQDAFIATWKTTFATDSLSIPTNGERVGLDLPLI